MFWQNHKLQDEINWDLTVRPEIYDLYYTIGVEHTVVLKISCIGENRNFNWLKNVPTNITLIHWHKMSINIM